MWATRVNRSRATSMQEQEQHKSKLPTILTPTFGDWKLIQQDNHRAHPKISRRSPLFHKFGLMQPKKAVTPQAQHNGAAFRGLRSEEQSQRIAIKEWEERVSTNETNNNIHQCTESANPSTSSTPYKMLRNLPSREVRSMSTNNNQPLLSECQQLFDMQKQAFEEILKQNNIYHKYHRVIEKKHQSTNQQILKIYNQYKQYQ